MVERIEVSTSSYQSPVVRFGIRFLAVLLVIGGGFAGYASVARFIDARRSLAWPSTQGEITQSVVEETRSSATNRSFRPRVTYRYTVDDREYVGKAISEHDVGYGDREVAERIVNAYPVGSLHPVYYDPADGSSAVLEPGLSWRAYLFLAIPPVMIAFGVLLFRVAKLLKREPLRPESLKRYRSRSATRS